MATWKKYKFSDFLTRVKTPVFIDDREKYKRVTIKTKHGGVSLRDIEMGTKIGTKKQFLLKKGQFVLSKIDARYGAFGIAPEEVDNAIITGNFWAYDFDKNIISIEWLDHFTNSPSFYDICERASSGITHRKYLDENKFLNNEIFLPNIDEQDAILTKISSKRLKVKKLTSEISCSQTLLKKLRRQTLQEAIEGKLTADWRAENPNVEPASELLARIKAEKEALIQAKKIKKQKPLPPITDKEKPFDLPDGWVWCRLGDLCDYEQGIQVDLHKQRKTGGSNLVRFLRIVDFTQETDDQRFIESPGRKYHIDNDELVMVRYGASSGFVGTGKTGVLANNLFKIKYGKLNKLFLSYFFISPYFLKLLAFNARGVAMPAISFKFLDALLFPLPPLLEQKTIVGKVEKLFAICDQLEAQITQNQAHAEALMQAVLKEAFQHEQADVC